MSFLTEPITLQSLFGPKRKIGTITVQVLLNETTTDKLTITKHPVQQGAPIADHAFKEPTAYSCSILFKDNIGVSLNQLYQDLQDLQNQRVVFSITTPKRIYKNMLMDTLSSTTDKTSENCLAISMGCSEVIIVPVGTTQVPRQRQKNAGKTGATQKAGKKSALLTTKEAITGLVAPK